MRKRCHEKKRLCTSGMCVFVKVAQTSKMTLGLGAPPLPPQMKMSRAFEKSCVRTDGLTIDAIASELGISHGSVHSILHDDLSMYRICLHMVPKMLSPEQKEQCQT
ncbi:hypothetical protein AVEN_261098-1 [Araneus ventricosus]|uniref:Uncharacterized protein n=1 Tax=Araneus ventricosus TaxID=182803 RepID=A0A4Y2UKR4_ARAVE|nr:hypothetical protein AVEN_180309-1 [Araneus ventricosus]GBO12157.1 hypothetical protein AVEN_261098-1 [Araneus ventricosus]